MNIGCSAVLIVVLGCVLVTAEDCYIPMLCNNVPSWGKLPGNIQTDNVVGSEVCERQINKLNDNIANLTERAAALEKYFDDLEKQHQYNITKDATTRNSNITLSPQPGKNTFAETDNTTAALRDIDETTTDASTTGEANLLFYNGKEFIVLVDKIRYMVDAEQECNDRGGELANIYDQINMDRIMKYIREDIMADNDTIKDFMLGMTYLNTVTSYCTNVHLHPRALASIEICTHVHLHPWTFALMCTCTHIQCNLVHCLYP
uniref:uncharacterized protein LOC120342846 isoform X1 n=1 Tax=Styela clava TaxID=7725 RepID=UPI001939EE5F|nr:uncharacterized protein LOC120342846 isoform X1 [Styela clava]